MFSSPSWNHNWTLIKCVPIKCLPRANKLLINRSKLNTNGTFIQKHQRTDFDIFCHLFHYLRSILFWSCKTKVRSETTPQILPESRFSKRLSTGEHHAPGLPLHFRVNAKVMLFKDDFKAFILYHCLDMTHRKNEKRHSKRSRLILKPDMTLLTQNQC